MANTTTHWPQVKQIALTRMRPMSLALALACAAIFPTGSATAQGVNVWTYHNDNARTGVNPKEKDLKPAKVRTNFGKLRILSVDGDVYAQPLFSQECRSATRVVP